MMLKKQVFLIKSNKIELNESNQEIKFCLQDRNIYIILIKFLSVRMGKHQAVIKLAWPLL